MSVMMLLFFFQQFLQIIYSCKNIIQNLVYLKAKEKEKMHGNWKEEVKEKEDREKGKKEKDTETERKTFVMKRCCR